MPGLYCFQFPQVGLTDLINTFFFFLRYFLCGPFYSLYGLCCNIASVFMFGFLAVRHGTS